jgi:hypothetical protein
MSRCNVLDAQGQALERVEKKTINKMKKINGHEEKNKEDIK